MNIGRCLTVNGPYESQDKGLSKDIKFMGSRVYVEGLYLTFPMEPKVPLSLASPMLKIQNWQNAYQ